MRVVILLLSIVVVAALSRPPVKQGRGEHVSPMLPREEFLHWVGASHQQLVTDYFWMQTVQAVGSAATPEEYRDVYDYSDLVTSLDPSFMPVYSFAGASIPVNLGRETWVNTIESTRILEKGVRVAPRDVYLRILLAYNHSYFHKNYRHAAQILEETARLPGAPRYVSALATRLYAQSGDVEAGLALAQSLFENAEDPDTRKTFEQRVKELELERVLRQVDQAVSTYQKREGRIPVRVEELVSKGDLPNVPQDPLGGDLIIGNDGKSQSTALARRLTVYEPRKD